MNEETRKIEPEGEQTEPEVKTEELSEKDMDKVAGGKTFVRTRSNTL